MNNHPPLVSIGLPVYNGEQYLRQAIDSLLAQTFTDFELIISDNASTDQTEAICREYLAKDQRICYYRYAQNRGSNWNFNHLVSLATGKYFKWSSYDDLHEPTYLEKCVNVLENEPSVILCYSSAQTIDENGNYQGTYSENLNYRSPKPHERFYQLLQTYPGYHGTQIYGVMRSDALRQTKLLPNYPQDDRVLLSELSLLGEIHEVPEYLFNRRIHAQTSRVAHKTDEALSVWLDPNNKRSLIIPQLQRYLGFYLAIHRTPLLPQEKLLCYLQIGRRFFSNGIKTRVKGMGKEFNKTIQVLMKKPQLFKGK